MSATIRSATALDRSTWSSSLIAWKHASSASSNAWSPRRRARISSSASPSARTSAGRREPGDAHVCIAASSISRVYPTCGRPSAPLSTLVCSRVRCSSVAVEMPSHRRRSRSTARPCHRTRSRTPAGSDRPCRAPPAHCPSRRSSLASADPGGARGRSSPRASALVDPVDVLRRERVDPVRLGLQPLRSRLLLRLTRGEDLLATVAARPAAARSSACSFVCGDLVELALRRLQLPVQRLELLLLLVGQALAALEERGSDGWKRSRSSRSSRSCASGVAGRLGAAGEVDLDVEQRPWGRPVPAAPGRGRRRPARRPAGSPASDAFDGRRSQRARRSGRRSRRSERAPADRTCGGSRRQPAGRRAPRVPSRASRRAARRSGACRTGRARSWRRGSRR